MKEIKLIINDDVFSDLKNSIFARKLAVAHGGIQDLAIDKIIKAINNNEKEIKLQYKQNKKG